MADAGKPFAGQHAAAATVALEAVVAVSAFGGGIAMLRDPHGAMGLPVSMLDRLPVNSWRLPGLALIACNGVFPVAAALGELRGRPWTRRWGHAAAGVMLLTWPVAETALFGYPVGGEPRWLRPAVAGAGVALIGSGVYLRRVEAMEPAEQAAGAAPTPPLSWATPQEARLTGSP